MESVIASDISTIKWLLVGILVAAIVFLVVLCVFLSAAWMAIRELLHQRKSNVFSLIAKGHLERDEIEDLIEYTKEHLDTHPNNPDAYWYLARGYYQTQNWVESKRNFHRAVDISPGYSEAADDYLEEIEERLRDSKPQLID